MFRELGNKNPVLKFSTLSGVLEAQRQEEKVVLDLPVNRPEVVGDQFTELVKEVSCGLAVKEVLLSECTKKLMVRLEDTVSQLNLEKIKPAIARLPVLEDSGRVAGVILTARGDKTEETDFVSR